MASCSSSRSTARMRRSVLVCHHRIPAVLRVSGTKDNPGRRFWGCVHYQVRKECDFFCWANTEIDEPDPKKEKLRKKVVAMKLRLKSNEWKMKVAVYVGLVGWLGLIYLCFVDTGKTKPHHVMPLKFG
ncbi:hypothetical protein PIB30_017308 [Stylosanthes scabra]|uniref:GRF-type domain-containing protein n=1 Tax=Stylosanthes scabra TaxID=79078 RepID=A0ABU6S701_9FABA|nr:hypothetical protein [Stylosanthes scabra]